MRKVKLLGELGRKFGKSFNLDVRTPAEAIRAISANFPEFRNYLTESEKRGIGYKVIVGKDAQTIEGLHLPSGKQNIKIVPIVTGSGKGMTQFIIGAALLVAAIYYPPLATAGVAYGTTTYATMVGTIGVSMMIGGVIQMLTPIPKMEAGQTAENKPSFVFNGAVNTTAQGYPVPVGYGRMVVGSAVISAGISTEEMPI